MKIKNKKGNDAYAVLRIKDFRYFLLARFMFTFGIQMQAVIVGWQVYEITKDPFALGLVGISEAIPFISIALFAGYVADIVNRKFLVLAANFVYLICAITLFLFVFKFSDIFSSGHVFPIYSVIFVTGIARGFIYPAHTSIMAQLVPRELYANSTTWNSTFWHIATVTGPAVGGLIYGFAGIIYAYSAVVIFVMLSFILFLNVRRQPMPARQVNARLFDNLTAGVRFVFRNQVLLSAISLDMFAVLFGGAVAMLPVFAGDILKVGPEGLGFLRAAPAVGAVFMALILAHVPIQYHAGKKLLFSVAGFGICMILFALSKNFYLSLALLVFSGICDNVSVIIRGTITQLFTPDEMRGRVASVNSIFIGSSNEIGSFESGLAARIMGLIPSVIFGGFMTLGIVGATSKLAPKLRKLHLNMKEPSTG